MTRDARRRRHPVWLRLAWVVLACAAGLSAAGASAADQPSGKSPAPARDPIAKLQEKLDRGDARFNFDERHGYLSSLLSSLGIPRTSQSLVFSKTSFQRGLISRRTPRALYFNDDTYVGWVPGAPLLEVAAIDPAVGTVFYTLRQEPAGRPRFVRQTDECLQCHESGMTQNVPGLLMRSVFPNDQGEPVFSAGTFVTTEQSPWSQRWGGWYVSGTHGRMRHMGNVSLDDEEHPESLDVGYGANVTLLSRRVRTAPYLTPDSDIVALMVLGHQIHLHNVMSRASADVLAAERDQAAMNAALGQPPSYRSEGTEHRIASVCEPLVKALLFSGEARLLDPVAGTSTFTRDFAARGPRDRSGRSLRDFDLKTRLFAHPCSYLIYSEQFDALPQTARAYVYRRLLEVLSGKDTSPPFSHLSNDERSEILTILRETKQGLPADWNRR